jgi:glutamyl/glutaminyl-tRNA synthetase
LLYSAFGWESPQFAHLPLLLSKSKKKLSKREGDVAVKEFTAQGYLPEALINFVALLGWNPKTEQEIFTLEELIEQFSFEKVNKSGAVFDLEKLDWINGMYIRKMNLNQLYERILVFLPQLEKYPKEFAWKVLQLERERLKKLSEIGERVNYFFSEPDYDKELLRWKNLTNQEIKDNLLLAEKVVSSFKLQVSRDEIEKAFLSQITDKGSVLWPLRVVLTGQKASPGPFEILEAFLTLPNGKEIILQRIKKAVSLL